MSIDVAIVSIERRQFFRPLDMGLRSEIRSIESASGLFHIAAIRMLVGEWAGTRVGIVLERGQHPPLPSWDEIMSRSGGWTNILPHVIADLVDRHAPFLDTLHNGTVADLLCVLDEHLGTLTSELEELDEDGADRCEPEERRLLETELSVATNTLERLLDDQVPDKKLSP